MKQQFVLAILDDMRIDFCKLLLQAKETVVIDQSSDTSQNDTLTRYQKNFDSKLKKREDLIRKFSSERSSSDDSNAESKLIAELSTYHAEIIDVHNFELMPWWRSKAQAYPMLAALIRAVHCIPATSTDIERVWSSSGLVISSRRSSIGSNNFKHQLHVHENWDLVKLCIER